MDNLNTIKPRRGKATKAKSGLGHRIAVVSAAIGHFLLAFSKRFSWLIYLLSLLIFVWGCIKVFEATYYRNNEVFMVNPDDIVVEGNSTIPREYILACFDITGKRNGFKLVDSDIVQKLRQYMPILKEAKISYITGGKVYLWVEERMPIARIAGDPLLVVDEEGVIFTYTRPTTTFPEIGGFDLPEEELHPGKTLPDSLHCMLRLLQVASDTKVYFPSAVKRVFLLGIDPEDGLKVMLVDGRKVDIAWDDMATETAVSEAMVSRLRNVARTMRSSAAEGKTHFNAMSPDRVTVSE